jgi:Ca2+-binding EF-hand superfamily protein
MNRKLASTTLAVAALVASAAALAQTRDDRPRRGPFGGPGPIERADRDGDGAVSAAEWSALFTALDTDANGTLEGAELPHRGPHGRFGRHHEPPAEALAHFIARDGDADRDRTVTAAEWQARVEALDDDDDGALSLSELPMRGHHWRGDERSLPPFFARWDTNGDGRFQSAELQALFEAADRDHDGTLDRDDFWRGED